MCTLLTKYSSGVLWYGIEANNRFGDGQIVRIAGRGTVLFELNNGGHKVFTNVYSIPKLKNSIIGLGQLEEHGCKIVLIDDYLWAYMIVSGC